MWQCYHWPENHEWTIKTRVLTVYLALEFDEMQKDYLLQALIFFAGFELKKKKKTSCHLFKGSTINLHTLIHNCRTVHWTIKNYSICLKYSTSVYAFCKITCVVFGVHCVFQYTGFWSEVREKFQSTTTYDTNVKYQIWSFCCNLFLSYVDKRHTDQLLKM